MEVNLGGQSAGTLSPTLPQFCPPEPFWSLQDRVAVATVAPFETKREELDQSVGSQAFDETIGPIQLAPLGPCHWLRPHNTNPLADSTRTRLRAMVKDWREREGLVAYHRPISQNLNPPFARDALRNISQMKEHTLCFIGISGIKIPTRRGIPFQNNRQPLKCCPLK